MSDPVVPSDPQQLRAVVEALIFAASEPLTVSDLADLFPGKDQGELVRLLEEVVASCRQGDRGVQVMQVAGGYRMTTKPDLGPWVRALFRARNRRRLSNAALETLAIIAYRQPITTPEIQELRRADPTGVLQTLLDRKLVRVMGRKKVVGKPILYGTTRDFLAHFGLNSLEDLPSMEEFGEMVSAIAPSREEPRPGPLMKGGDGGNGGDFGELDDESEDENERKDDGYDS